MFIKPNSTMVFSAVTKKKTFFSLHGSITTKSLLNSFLVLCVFVKMNLFLLDSVDKKNWKTEHCFEYRYFAYLHIKISNFSLFWMAWRLNVHRLFYGGRLVRDNDDSISYTHFLLEGGNRFEFGVIWRWKKEENLEARACCVKQV